MKILGIDTGGTFTDFIYTDGSDVRVHKVLSTPEAPEQAILQGIREMAVELIDLEMVHGSTVATNAVLEGKGVQTVYITNRGFADVLTIGRQARRELYNLTPAPREAPVPEERCLETGGRLNADGELLEPLTSVDLAELGNKLRALEPEAVAINLLFSFIDPSLEKKIAEVVPEGVFVSRSSEVLNEIREYERGMATWLNAYVGPLMKRYLDRLSAEVSPARVAVMQSHGGTQPADRAGQQAVELLLSGPAGGLVGAKYQAARSNISRLMTFDMGGTSTDVALIDGDIRLTSESEIAGHPVAVPMVDMHTIGAGGGSIAWIDTGGMLQVGPQSAGAEPGPACYSQGGTQATVTDANLVLGRLPRQVALGGNLPLDCEASRLAVSALAESLGLDIEATAAGIVRIADEHMAQALRVISVQRGHDPADYALMCFGGAGGLHVCSLAEELGMSRALVPKNGGVLSALGMVVSKEARQLTHSRIGLLRSWKQSDIRADFEALRLRLKAEMGKALEFEQTVDLRYHGQSAALTLPWTTDWDVLEASFHNAHITQFGYALEQVPLELVKLKLRGTHHRTDIELPVHFPDSPARPLAEAFVAGIGEVPVYARDAVSRGQVIKGPAIIVENVSTTWLAPGWWLENDAAGNLLLAVCE
ncbi:MAG: hydantoinase/oxoprolinase family protein [Thiotrichales bacterium]